MIGRDEDYVVPYRHVVTDDDWGIEFRIKWRIDMAVGSNGEHARERTTGVETEFAHDHGTLPDLKARQTVKPGTHAGQGIVRQKRNKKLNEQVPRVDGTQFLGRHRQQLLEPAEYTRLPFRPLKRRP